MRLSRMPSKKLPTRVYVLHVEESRKASSDAFPFLDKRKATTTGIALLREARKRLETEFPTEVLWTGGIQRTGTVEVSQQRDGYKHIVRCHVQKIVDPISIRAWIALLEKQESSE